MVDMSIKNPLRGCRRAYYVLPVDARYGTLSPEPRSRGPSEIWESEMSLVATYEGPRRSPLFGDLFLRVRQHFKKRAAEEAERKRWALAYARAGARELERRMPGSIASLDEQRLDISSPRVCALAQIFGSYHDAPQDLKGGNVGKAFLIPDGLTKRHMNDAWRTLIKEVKAV